MKTNKSILLLPFILIISLGLSYYFGEDSLGGARHDYLFHEKFFSLFLNDFSNTFQKYGTSELFARNSPIFYIIIANILKTGINLESIRYANAIIIIPYIYIFLKCLEIKYINLDFNTKIIFSSIILISPTIRSLCVWPYPLIWALLFFLIAILNFLKFQEATNRKKKNNYAILNIVFVAISSYLTPNFAVFSIYFLIIFFNYFKFSKELLILIIINILFSIPALYYFAVNDFYLLRSSVFELDNSLKYNFYNKIVIISSMIFYYFLPYIYAKNFEIVKKRIFNFDLYTFIILIFITCNILFFNFPKGAGGGIFYHFSHLFFGNSSLLFCVFFISIFIFRIFYVLNLNNILLFLILILYNLQFTIYHKYFDPLIYFLLLFLFKFDIKEENFNYRHLSYKFLFLYLFFLSISFIKKFIIY